jgi:putative membrane protein
MHSKFWLVGFVAGALIACGGKSTPEGKTAEEAQAEAIAYTPAAETTGAATGQPYTPTSPPTAGSERGPVVVVVDPPPLPYSDGQIASITDAANTAEVEQGTLAQSKAKDARVKKFAAMMVVDHSQAKRQQADLIQRLGITAIETKKSAAIAEESNRTLESLRALSRNEFDRAYIDVQVDTHQKVIDSFDNELIPNTKNSEFKAALVELRPQLESHLKEAQDIQQALASAPLSPVGKSSPSEGVRQAPLGGKQPSK